MKHLACPAVLRELQAYHDEELQVTDQIAIAAHVDGCRGCREALLPESLACSWPPPPQGDQCGWQPVLP